MNLPPLYLTIAGALRRVRPRGDYGLDEYETWCECCEAIANDVQAAQSGGGRFTKDAFLRACGYREVKTT